MNSHYSMEIHWSDEDHAFIVTLPEFPVCQTHGATYDEAVKNGQEALELIIETYRADGRELPEPLTDRKSTRLNSSHANISYAVFCLKQQTRSNVQAFSVS